MPEGGQASPLPLLLNPAGNGPGGDAGGRLQAEIPPALILMCFHIRYGDGTAAPPPPSQEHDAEVAGHGTNADPGGPWDAVRIVAPQCEVYVCVGRADGAER